MPCRAPPRSPTKSYSKHRRKQRNSSAGPRLTLRETKLRLGAHPVGRRTENSSLWAYWMPARRRRSLISSFCFGTSFPAKLAKLPPARLRLGLQMDNRSATCARTAPNARWRGKRGFTTRRLRKTRSSSTSITWMPDSPPLVTRWQIPPLWTSGPRNGQYRGCGLDLPLARWRDNRNFSRAARDARKPWPRLAQRLARSETYSRTAFDELREVEFDRNSIF